ncbi:MAG TPA: hypothetical protein VFP72_01900 [Kineosporiaceae bacterium]|nr:hypothetical protein [Kineosporiaceae bacterium]
MAVRVAPIGEDDVPEVADFLTEHLNRRIPPDIWAAAIRPGWSFPAPNHGFLLRDGDRVVGAYLAFYSERTIAGQRERFCNLAAWCVHPDHRFHGLRLLKALLDQPGYHFTDLSPSGAVIPLNRRFGFTQLDTTTALVPPQPWRWLSRTRVSSDPAVIAATLTGPQRELFEDHRHLSAARHVVLVRGERVCYVMFRKVRRKNLPGFAALLHVSDPQVLRGGIGPLTRHLLLRHGVLLTLAEVRVAGFRPRPSHLLASARPKMFRSSTLGPDQIDDLYSELVCVPW